MGEGRVSCNLPSRLVPGTREKGIMDKSLNRDIEDQVKPLNDEFVKHINLALEAIPPREVTGVLFGVLCGIMYEDGFDSEEKLRDEFERGLQFLIRVGALEKLAITKLKV